MLEDTVRTDQAQPLDRACRARTELRGLGHAVLERRPDPRGRHDRIGVARCEREQRVGPRAQRIPLRSSELARVGRDRRIDGETVGLRGDRIGRALVGVELGAQAARLSGDEARERRDRADVHVDEPEVVVGKLVHHACERGVVLDRRIAVAGGDHRLHRFGARCEHDRVVDDRLCRLVARCRRPHLDPVDGRRGVRRARRVAHLLERRRRRAVVVARDHHGIRGAARAHVGVAADLAADPAEVLSRQPRSTEGVVEEPIDLLAQLFFGTEIGELLGHPEEVHLLRGSRIEVGHRHEVGAARHLVQDRLGRPPQEEVGRRGGGHAEDQDGGADQQGDRRSARARLTRRCRDDGLHRVGRRRRHRRRAAPREGSDRSWLLRVVSAGNREP